MENLVNMTPHEVIIVMSQDKKIAIPPSGAIARLTTETVKLPPVEVADGLIPVVSVTYGDPKIQYEENSEVLDFEGKILIVSSLLGPKAEELKKMTGAAGIYAPDTSPQGAIRDKNNRITGVKRLVKLA